MMNINEHAPVMSYAGNLRCFAVIKQTIEASIAVRMHPAFVIGQVSDWMLALTINRELIPCTRRGLAIPWPLIANISPDPRRFGAFIPR